MLDLLSAAVHLPLEQKESNSLEMSDLAYYIRYRCPYIIRIICHCLTVSSSGNDAEAALDKQLKTYILTGEEYYDVKEKS